MSAIDRQNIYQRTLGTVGGDESVTRNRAFGELWIRFVSAVAEAASQQRTLEAACDLAVNSTLHGFGMAAYAAQALTEQIRSASAVLSDPEVQSAFGARDMWQVVDRVASLHLGETVNIARFVAMASSGTRIFEWLAAHAASLLKDSGSGTDAGPVDACEQWLAASRHEDEGEPPQAPTGSVTRAIGAAAVARQEVEACRRAAARCDRRSRARAPRRPRRRRARAATIARVNGCFSRSTSDGGMPAPRSATSSTTRSPCARRRHLHRRRAVGQRVVDQVRRQPRHRGFAQRQRRHVAAPRSARLRPAWA